MQLHFQTLFTQKKSIRSFWFTVLHVGAGPMIPQARGSHGRPADGVSIGGRAAVHSRGATDLEREVNPVLCAEQVSETWMQAQNQSWTKVERFKMRARRVLGDYLPNEPVRTDPEKLISLVLELSRALEEQRRKRFTSD